MFRRIDKLEAKRQKLGEEIVKSLKPPTRKKGEHSMFLCRNYYKNISQGLPEKYLHRFVNRFGDECSACKAQKGGV